MSTNRCRDPLNDKTLMAELAEIERQTGSSAVREGIAALARLLRRFGPTLRRPHCDTLKGSKHPNGKELHFTLPEGERRVAFVFDPRRSAILTSVALLRPFLEFTLLQNYYYQVIRTAGNYAPVDQYLGKGKHPSWSFFLQKAVLNDAVCRPIRFCLQAHLTGLSDPPSILIIQISHRSNCANRPTGLYVPAPPTRRAGPLARVMVGRQCQMSGPGPKGFPENGSANGGVDP